jgi:hypothetical protein
MQLAKLLTCLKPLIPLPNLPESRLEATILPPNLPKSRLKTLIRVPTPPLIQP